MRPIIRIRWISNIALALLIFITVIDGVFAKRFDDLKQRYVEGKVYEDQNENGQWDEGETGISEVMVSNQREVIRTDEDGNYRLPIAEEMIIFVTKPAGYEFLLNGNNLPEFYYIHQPEGSPEGLSHPGLEPTGPLPKSVNFGLISSERKDRFTAIAFGDPQPRDNIELSYFRDDVVAEMANVEADLSLVLGDIMFDDLSMYERYNSIMRTMEIPVFNIVGNHDINYDSIEYDEDGNRYAKETFKRFYGPTYFSYNYGQVHFMALDNIDYFEDPDEEGSGAYRGYLSDQQLEWIENDLDYVDKDQLIVLMGHIPLFGWEGDEPYLNTMNRESLIRLLDDYSNVLFLCGHIHMNYHHFLGNKLGRTNSRPIHHIATSAASGTWWGGPENEYGVPITTQRDGVPNGYHLLRFDGNSYTERYKGAGFGENYQLRIESPRSRLSVEKTKDEEILVNIFNGSKRSSVEYRINEGEWTEMDHVETGMSPFVQKLQKRTEDTHSDWINPTRTNHLWKADFPQNIPVGISKLTVRTQDMFGQEFTRSKIIEIDK